MEPLKSEVDPVGVEVFRFGFLAFAGYRRWEKMPKNPLGLFSTCYYFAFARTLWGYCFAVQFSPKLLAKYAPLGLLDAAGAAPNVDDLADRLDMQVTGVESQLVMDTVQRSETVGLVTRGTVEPYDSLQLLAAAQLGFVRTMVQKINSMERRIIQPAAPTTNYSAVAQLSMPEPPVDTSVYSPELLKETIPREAAPSEVQAAISTRHEQLMKEIVSSKTTLRVEDHSSAIVQPSMPETSVATSTYRPELLKEIIHRRVARSEVPAATSTRHKQLMEEIVSSKATIPDMHYTDQIMHYFTTRWPDRSIDARPSTVTQIRQAAPRASTQNCLVALKCGLLLVCFLGMQLYVSWRLGKFLQAMIECNTARHALAQAAARGAGTETGIAY